MSELFVMLRDFCLSRFGSRLIGIFAICSLIWFASPYLGITSVYQRGILIFSIIALCGLAIIVRLLWARSRGKSLQNKLQQQDEQGAGRQLEIELLKEKMADAIASLKSSELGVKYRGNAALYALPWFMIIGPSAAGKSTLLRNSGLHFPFSSQEDLHVKGFGGTRNCDWWFADEGIILDTAGRYTTEEDDQQEWQVFLSLLKKHRPRLPINGIIVAMSIVDLLTADQQGNSWHVKIIRERIEELYSQLGYVFPVYLIFTKCDLLKGFASFFDDMSEMERRQIWGLNLACDNLSYDKKVNLFSEQLENLYVKLTQVRLHKLSVERNLQRKAEIYDFPEQFHAAMPKIVEFVRLLFKDNPYQEMPNYLGAYFTSGAQEGLSIHYLPGQLQTAFDYVEKTDAANNTAPTETKSYFIKDVFSDCIFPNKNFSAKTQQRLHMQRWLKSASVVTAGGVIIATFMLYSASFASNALFLWHGQRLTQELAAGFTSSANNTTQITALLDAGDYYQSLLDYRQQIPWHLRLGLYRGNAQIQPLSAMLILVLQKNYLPALQDMTVIQLRSYAQQWPTVSGQAQEQLRASYYTLLKAYLMACFPQRIDVEQAVPALSIVWGHVLQQDQQRLASLVRLYLMQLQQSVTSPELSTAKPWSTQDDVIAQARQQLYSSNDAGNLYAQLRSTGATVLTGVNVQDLIHGHGANLLTNQYQLPGMYTAKAWHDYVQHELHKIVNAASAGDWVMDAPLADLNQPTLMTTNKTFSESTVVDMEKQIQQLYFDDYVHAWITFMNSIRVVHFTSLEDATSQLNILANKDGPLVQLAKALTQNLFIKEDYSEESVLSNSFSSVQPIIAGRLGSNMSDSMQSYLHGLTQVRSELEHLAASSDAGRHAQQYASQILSGSGNNLELYKAMVAVNLLVNPIDNGAARAPIQSILLQPIREAWRAVLVGATQGLQQQWQTQVYAGYSQNIAGKFPFSPRASQDVNLADVTNFIAPRTGVLWNFINTNLTPYLYSDANGWHEQQWLKVDVGFSPQFLQALSQAKSLSDNLFENGTAQPSFNFQIYPEPTQGLSEIILLMNGQTYRYRNGPQQWQTLTWSTSNNDQPSELTAIAAYGLSPDTLQAQGPWGLFHLLAQSHLTSEANNSYRARWELKTAARSYSVSVLLKTENNSNVFNQLLNGTWQLPANLFD
jgi:type VI secretion system protein ImpL